MMEIWFNRTTRKVWKVGY